MDRVVCPRHLRHILKHSFAYWANTQVVMKQACTNVSVRLADFVIADPAHNTRHPMIVRSLATGATDRGGGSNAGNVQSPLITCEVVVYNNEARDSPLDSDNLLIQVHASGLRVVLLHRFIAGVVGFLANFKSVEQAIAEAGADAADLAAQNMVTAYEQALRIRFNMHVRAPVIYVPIDSQAQEALVLDLGEWSITNEREMQPGTFRFGSPAVIDQVQLKVGGLLLSRVASMAEVGMPASEKNILKPTQIVVMVYRNLSFDWWNGRPKVEAVADLKTIVLNLHQDDVHLLLSILARNLTEGEGERANQISRKNFDLSTYFLLILKTTIPAIIN